MPRASVSVATIWSVTLRVATYDPRGVIYTHLRCSQCRCHLWWSLLAFMPQEVQKLMEENLRIVCAKFSALSLAVCLIVQHRQVCLRKEFKIQHKFLPVCVSCDQ